MVTAIVAQTKDDAKVLARALGVETRFLFGARCADRFKGLRAELVYIDAAAQLAPRFMDTIRATVLKTGRGGRIRFVTSDGRSASE